MEGGVAEARGQGAFSALFTCSTPPTAKISWEDHHPTLQQQRREELQARRETYR